MWLRYRDKKRSPIDDVPKSGLRTDGRTKPTILGTLNNNNNNHHHHFNFKSNEVSKSIMHRAIGLAGYIGPLALALTL